MDKIKLELFIFGQSAISKRAVRNLESLCCQETLKELCDIEIIDLLAEPEKIEKEKILATPLLIKKSPLPQRRMIGDLSNIEKVMAAIDINGTGYEK